MNDERCVRDRVTAVLTLAEAATPGPWRWDGLTTLENPETYQAVYEVEHDHGCACRKDCTMDVELSEGDAHVIAASRSETPWLARRLLEALDAIDKARELHRPEESPGWITRCVRCQTPWPCDDWQALNGEGESRC